ncbi:MAG: hypothetical protein Fur0010_09880 [Bdellovibrio sp.]
MKYISIIALLALVSCGSGKIVPTTDVCSLKKHYKDNIFQVLINDKPINKHWYIYDEAIDITKQLATKNKCKS